MQLGKYIKDIIKNQGRTIAWVSDQLNINERTFAGKLNRDSITGEDLLRISSILGINLEQLKEEMLNMNEKNFNYKLNDQTSYGIYNGINRDEIYPIAKEIANQLGLNVLDYDTDTITRKVRDSKEIEAIAMETYKSYPIHNDWTEEYKEMYREMVEKKQASGIGIVPYGIIRDFIALELQEIANSKKQLTDASEAIFMKAKETGERQLIGKFLEDVEEEENSMNIVYKWAMPNGETVTQRIPTH